MVLIKFYWYGGNCMVFQLNKARLVEQLWLTCMIEFWGEIYTFQLCLLSTLQWALSSFIADLLDLACSLLIIFRTRHSFPCWILLTNKLHITEDMEVIQPQFGPFGLYFSSFPSLCHRHLCLPHLQAGLTEFRGRWRCPIFRPLHCFWIAFDAPDLL